MPSVAVRRELGLSSVGGRMAGRGIHRGERFEQRQRGFHRKQFKPFEPVLFGKYATDFRGLEDKITDPISDEDYPPIESKGWIRV